MSRVLFTYRTGRTAMMPERTAALLTRLGKGEYNHRMITPSRMVQPTVTPVAPDLDLDVMDVDDLRALAAERGVYVHHKAGAERIRQALRDAEQ